MKAFEHLERAAELNRKKNDEYKDGHIIHGRVMAALFPEGLGLEGPDDFGRFAVLDLIVVKLVRYTRNFGAPHVESIRDLTVYSAMLEELDEKCLDNRR